MIAFIINDKQLLLLKHTYQYQWALPGGWMKRGENLYQVMEREIKEELGLETKVTDIIEVRSVMKKPVVEVAVVCDVTEGKLQRDLAEIEEAKFFPFDSLPDNIIKTNKPYIERFLNLMKTN